MEWVTLSASGSDYKNLSPIVCSGTTITMATVASGTGNTKGGWVKVSNGIPSVSHGIILSIWPGTGNDILLDVSTTSGTAGLIISNLLMGLSTSVSANIFLPVVLPGNSDIWVRSQTPPGSSQPVDISVSVGTQPFMDRDEYTRITTYGANTADSGGTGIDPGGTPFTWSGWTEIVASSLYPIHEFLLAIGDQNNTNLTAGRYLFQIGIGAGGSEIPIFSGMFVANSNDDCYYPAYFGPIKIYIPAGTRISVRGMSEVSDATDRLFDVAIYAFD